MSYGFYAISTPADPGVPGGGAEGPQRQAQRQRRQEATAVLGLVQRQRHGRPHEHLFIVLTVILSYIVLLL